MKKVINRIFKKIGFTFRHVVIPTIGFLGVPMFTLFGCGNQPIETPAPYNDASTQFIVVNIEAKEGMKEMTTYQIEVVDANDLVSGSDGRNLKFWCCDTLGKYKLGQPIHFDKTR